MKAAVSARHDGLDLPPGISAHAAERAAQRCPRPPRRSEWLDVVASILDRRALLLRVNQDGAAEHYLVELSGVPMHVVWIKATATVATVYEPGHYRAHLERSRAPARHAWGVGA